MQATRSESNRTTYLKFLGIPNYDGEVLNVFL